MADNTVVINTESLPVINFEELKKELLKVKTLARETERRAEISKHRSPQIKRSVGFIYDVKNAVADSEELVLKLKSVEMDVSAQQVVLQLADRI